MKKVLILLLVFACSLRASAQKPTTRPITNLPMKGSKILQPISAAKQTAIGMMAKAKDLAVSELQIQQDVSSGLYIISCKITNKGTLPVLLDPIAYSVWQNGQNFTPQNTLVVECKIEPENCSLSPCGYNYVLYVCKPDGNFFEFTTPSTEAQRTLQPGESFIAKTIRPTPISWGKPNTCSSQKIEVKLVLDPLNRIGDGNISNNTFIQYFPIQSN